MRAACLQHLRLFVDSTRSRVLPALTLTNSSVSDNFARGSGGGIYNRGTLTLTNNSVQGNRTGTTRHESCNPICFFEPCCFVYYTTYPGGGIWNKGTLTLSNSSVSGNYSSAGAGGIDNAFGGMLMLTNSTVSENNRGIHNSGTAVIANTTVSGNSGTLTPFSTKEP